MKNSTLAHKKNISSTLLLTLALLLSFFMCSGNVGFSPIQAQKTQTEVPADFKPWSVTRINYYDNRAVLKNVHFLCSDKDLGNALIAFNRMVGVEFNQLTRKCFLFAPITSFYQPKTIPESQDEDDFSFLDA